MLVAVDAPVLHQHRDATPAWYDEECPSRQLAAGRSDLGILPVLGLVQVIPVVDSVVPAPPTGALGAVLLPLSARGPPPAS